MSRLLREDDPPFGERPGVEPQHFDADGNLVRTGENNPLPTANYVQNQSGLWVPVNQDNPMPISGDVQLTGSIGEKVVIETLLDAESVPAGSFVTIPLNPKGENELYLLISIDKQPWTLRTNAPNRSTPDYVTEVATFPRYINETNTYTHVRPAQALFLGTITDTGFVRPTTLAEAKQYPLTPYPNASIRVDNNSDTTSTVTVRVMRVWRY